MAYEEGMDGYDPYEGQPRWPLRRIVRTAVFTITALIYAIVFIRLFTSCNSRFEKMILLEEKVDSHALNSLTVTRVFTETGEKDDGTVQIQYPVYIEQYGNFQLTCKIKKSALAPGKGEPGFRFVIREEKDGELRTVPLSYFEAEDRFGYRYARVCFNGITLEEGSVLTLMIFPENTETCDREAALVSQTVLDRDTYRVLIHPKAGEYSFLSKK